MKLPPVLTGVALNPAARTLDFSALGGGFDPLTVLAVLHGPTNRFIFAKGRQGLGYTAIAGAVMTLAMDTPGLAAGPLITYRDDGALIATDARLEVCRGLIATGNAVASNIATAVGTPSDVDPGADASPGSIVALLRRGLGRWTTFFGRYPAALGPTNAAGSIPVTLPADGQFTASVGLPADAAATSDAGAASLTALAKRALGNWTTLLGRVTGPVVLDATAQTGNATLSNLYTGLGTPADAASATTGSVGSAIALLKALRDKIVGGVLAVSQSGTWAVNATLQAGTAVIGRVGLQVAGADVAASNPVPVSDANGAAYSAASALTAGTAAPPGRSVGVACANAGTITLTLTSGGTIALPVYPGWQIYPFAATQFAFSSGATGSVYNLA